MNREVKIKVKGYNTIDGGGVNLVRVLGINHVKEFDPILMLDSFDSTNPDDYTAGFPMHPHRGIETISYLSKGKMIHRDSLGNEEEINDGEVQWMNSGSGIMHEEMIPASQRLLGVQLWLNLPKENKMSKPSYKSIKNIKEIDIENGKLRLLAGQYKDIKGESGHYLPLDYYDICLNENASFTLECENNASIMLFTLSGDIYINDEFIEEKTAVKLTLGDKLTIVNGDKPSHILYISSKSLNEPIASAGPIVMNSKEEIYEAYNDLRNNTFIKEETQY